MPSPELLVDGIQEAEGEVMIRVQTRVICSLQAKYGEAAASLRRALALVESKRAHPLEDSLRAAVLNDLGRFCYPPDKPKPDASSLDL